MILWLGVAVAGGLGAILRYLVDAAVSRHVGRALPYGTLAVNLSGALVLGVLSGAALSHDAYLLVGTGVVGSYTTFSTWMFETQRLAEDGQPAAAFANVAVSLALGLAAAALGQAL